MSRRSPPSSASMPRPRTKMRFGALTATSRVASKGAADLARRPAAATCASRSAFAFSRARSSGGVLTWRMPGRGCTVAGRRSGTETSIETTSTRPVTRGVRASGPLKFRFRLAIADRARQDHSRAGTKHLVSTVGGGVDPGARYFARIAAPNRCLLNQRNFAGVMREFTLDSHEISACSRATSARRVGACLPLTDLRLPYWS